MEIISSLVRTEISVGSVSREEDEFVVEGETLGMPSKVYVRPDEIGDMIGVFLSWQAIAYFLRWPFLYARWYMEGEDFPRQVRSFGLVLSLSLVGVLLLGARSYILAHPREGVWLFLSFAVFSLVASLATNRRSLFYGAVIMAEIAEHLLLYQWQVPATSYATWSLAPLAILALLGSFVQKRASNGESGSPIAKALFRNGYILASFYAAVLIWSFGAHMEAGAWRIYVPLIGFAAYFIARFAASLRLAQLYFAVIYLAVGYFLLVGSLSGVPSAYRSLPLLALAIGMMLVASAYHEALHFRLLHPLYLAGMIISLLALIYAAGGRIPMLIYLVAMAAHYFWMHREATRKLTAEQPSDQFVMQTAFGFANGAAYLAVLLFFIYDFQPFPAILLAALALSLLYLKVGFYRPRTVFRRRNQYIYWAGVFWAIFVATSLRWLGAQHPWSSRAPFVVPFALIALIVGLWTLRSYADEERREDIGRAVLEAGYLLIAVSYLLPYVMGQISLLASLVLTILYALVFLILYGVTRQDYLAHGFSVVLLFFFSHLVSGLIANPASHALIFTAAGVLCMVAAVVRRPEAALPRHTLYLAWFVLSGLSLYAALPHRASMLVISLAWGAAYLFGSLMVEREPSAPASAPVPEASA